MKKALLILLFIVINYANAQNNKLAYDYFRKGEFEKSAAIYEELYNKNTRSNNYFKQLLKCYQELEYFPKADTLLLNHLNKYPKKGYLFAELGYNYQLQNQQEKATPLYEKAIKAVELKPTSAYQTGRTFQENHLLDYAIQTYEIAMQKQPSLNFDVYIANIYGEKGEINNMFNAYLDMVEKKESAITTVQRYISKFITNDNQNTNNLLFRKLVLTRLQNNPNNSWNKLLSWLYMQQKDYNKALIQEKAIYNRNGSDLNSLFNVADISYEDNDYLTAEKAYAFIIENAKNNIDILYAKNQLIQIAIKLAKTEEDYNNIEQKYKQILTEFGTGSNTVKTQINFADFLVFSKNKPNEAITILNQAKTVASSKFLQGEIKIKLADILVFNNKFNQALITYTQVQSDIRSSDIAQIARLKVAKTSYYKGDFDWAKIQLKVLKAATSKLISNNALKLNLLIGDNIAGDTIRVALKKYAKADLLSYQNKTQQAIDTLSLILKDYKGHAIEDEALFKQAELYKKQNKYELAVNNYIKITKLKKEGILVDDAYYELGEIYSKQLNDTEKAKEMYQKIIFDYANSIFLVNARKKYRKLRGDTLEQ